MGTRNGKSDQFDLSDLVVGVMAPEMFADGFGATEDFHCRFADKCWENIEDAFGAGQIIAVRVMPHEQLMALTALRYELGHADLQFRYDESNHRLFVRRKPQDEPATDESEQGGCQAHGRIEIDADLRCNTPPHSEHVAAGRSDAGGATRTANGSQTGEPRRTRTADALPTLTVEYHDVGDIPTAGTDELRDSIDWFEARRKVRAGRAVSCRVAIQHLERAKSVLLDQLRFDNDDEDSWSACDWRYDLSTSTLWVWRSDRSPRSRERGDVIASGAYENFQKMSTSSQPAGSASRGGGGACAAHS